MTLFVLLVILLGTFGLLTAARKIWRWRGLDAGRRGQLSLAVLFVFTGLGHFVQTTQMAAMLPPAVPFRTGLVLASGVFEWLLAAGLFIPRYARVAGIAAIAFLILVFPGNVYAALNRVDVGGHGAGAAYLLVRAPFQLLLIGWAYWFAVRDAANSHPTTRSESRQR